MSASGREFVLQLTQQQQQREGVGNMRQHHAPGQQQPFLRQHPAPGQEPQLPSGQVRLVEGEEAQVKRDERRDISEELQTRGQQQQQVFKQHRVDVPQEEEQHHYRPAFDEQQCASNEQQQEAENEGRDEEERPQQGEADEQRGSSSSRHQQPADKQKATKATEAEEDEDERRLQEAVKMYLPQNYDFEVVKAIRRVTAVGAQHVALQMPEGLLRWALQLAAIIKTFARTVKEVTVLSDVAYGACCIDDVTPAALGCDFLLHYGHSCLVPLSHHRAPHAAIIGGAVRSTSDGHAGPPAAAAAHDNHPQQSLPRNSSPAAGTPPPSAAARRHKRGDSPPAAPDAAARNGRWAPAAAAPSAGAATETCRPAATSARACRCSAAAAAPVPATAPGAPAPAPAAEAEACGCRETPQQQQHSSSAAKEASSYCCSAEKRGSSSRCHSSSSDGNRSSNAVSGDSSIGSKSSGSRCCSKSSHNSSKFSCCSSSEGKSEAAAVAAAAASSFFPSKEKDQEERGSETKAKQSCSKLLGCLYVFVDILLDPLPLCGVLKQNFPRTRKLALLGTIQYAKFLSAVKKRLQQDGHFLVPPFIPQRAPLTAGEVLGCTAPKLASTASSSASFRREDVFDEASTASCSERTGASSSCLRSAEARRNTPPTTGPTVGGAAADSVGRAATGAAAGDGTPAVAARGGRGSAAAEAARCVTAATAAHKGVKAEAVAGDGTAETAGNGDRTAAANVVHSHPEHLGSIPGAEAAASSAAAKKAAAGAEAGGGRLRPEKLTRANSGTVSSETQDVEDVGSREDAAATGLLQQLQLVQNSSRKATQQQKASDVGVVHGRGTNSSAVAVYNGNAVEGSHPAAPGEEIDEVVFVADGRFHLEACMIQNPSLKFLRYDPFVKRLFRESYDVEQLHRHRRAAIQAARSARCAALLLSTLGRQGSVGVLEDLQQLLDARRLPYCVVLFSELSPTKLKRLAKCVDCFIQIACPRLSIDWGTGYATGGRPLLTPYEAHVAFGQQPYLDVYPMDYYSKDGGVWTNYNTSSGHRSGSLAPAISVQDRKAQLRARLLSRLKQRMQRQQQSYRKCNGSNNSTTQAQCHPSYAATTCH